MVRSIVEYFPEHEGYKCGYCRQPDTNYSHGMWAHMMSVSDYQRLIDRGWRRSGKYCYKPTMNLLCCPMYTIRCRAIEFKPTKSQKKILKKLNKFLANEKDTLTPKRPKSEASDGPDDCPPELGGDEFVESTRQCSEVDLNAFISATNNVQEKVHEDDKTISTSSKKPTVLEKTVKQGAGMDSAKGPCKKAKLMRLERKIEKLHQKGLELTSIQSNTKNKEKQLEDFLEEIPEGIRNRLEVRLVRTSPPSAEWLSTAAEAHRVYTLYQTAVHGDPVQKCSEPRFREFLVDSPLQEEYSEDGPPRGYGSFHQQYWLDGRLVATGVIDILPACVSSVYFFYDPQYRNLTFGTYGALRELAFTRYLHKISPSLKHYYMGFYIHSCRKMRYKGNFQPSDLLCPETYKWFPISDCIPKLEISPYSRLNPDLDAIDEDDCSERHLDNVPLLVNASLMTYAQYKVLEKPEKSDVDNLVKYAKLVGASSAAKLILCK